MGSAIGKISAPALRPRSRRGSTTVFLCVILSALIMLSFAMIWSAREHGINSRVDALMELGGESLMSQFNREILEGYGLFMVKCDASDMGRRLRSYLDPALSSSKNVSLGAVKVDGSRYAIVDPEPIRQQILDHMKSGGADLLLSRKKSARDSMGYHNLNHGPTIVSLPSRQLPDRDLWDVLGKLDHLKDVSSVFSMGTEKYLLSSYVLGTFNSCTGVAREDHFFHNEVEYVLCGRLTDEENEKATIRSLKTLRFPANLAHIYTDPEKMSQLTAAAEAIAPGPVGLAIQAALGAAWAWAESSNDAHLLLQGSKVPLTKDASTWALDLESVISSLVTGALDPANYGGAADDDSEAGGSTGGSAGGSGSGPAAGSGSGSGSAGSSAGPAAYGDDPEALLKKDRPVIRPERERGLTYEQYLRILLFKKEDPMIVMRVLDLIQINMRKDHDGSFLICEQCTGIAFESKVNGRVFSYDKKY